MKTVRDQRRVFIGEQFECSVSTANGTIRFRATAHSVGTAELTLRVSSRYFGSFSKGQNVEIIFGRPGKAFRFRTKVVSVASAQEHCLLTLSGLSKVEQIERRSVTRKPVKGSLEFSSKNGKSSITYNGKVNNVCEGGLMFSTMFGGMFAPGSKPIGLEVQMNLTLLRNKLATITGRVCHASPHPELREIVVINIEFTGISPGTKSRISKILRH